MVYVASERPVRIIIAIIIITNGYLIYDPYINIVPRHVCIIMPLSSFNSPCHGRIIGLLPRPAVSETAQLPVMGQFTIMIYLMGMRNHYSFCCNYNFFVIDQNMLFISWIGCPKMKGPLFFINRPVRMEVHEYYAEKSRNPLQLKVCQNARIQTIQTLGFKEKIATNTNSKSQSDFLVLLSFKRHLPALPI